MVYYDCINCSQPKSPPAGSTKFQCCFVFFFTLTKLTGKKKKTTFCIFFLLGGQKERPRSQRPPIETVLCGEPTSRAAAAGDESTCRVSATPWRTLRVLGGRGTGDSHTPPPWWGQGHPPPPGNAHPMCPHRAQDIL